MFLQIDTDVNLDFLTKEEKEALLSKKMDMIRQRNKALTERHQVSCSRSSSTASLVSMELAVAQGLSHLPNL